MKTRFIAWVKPDGRVSKIHVASYDNPFRSLCGHTSVSAEVIDPGKMTVDDMLELCCRACIYLHFSGAAAYYRARAKREGRTG